MADQIQAAKIICKGGLDTSQNFLELSDDSPGAAQDLVNYESSLFGGYRRINGYQPLVEQYPVVDPFNTEGPILLLAIFQGNFITARKNKASNTYNYYISSSNSDWIIQATPGYEFSSVGVKRIRFETYNFNGTDKIIFVDGVNPAVIFDGLNWNRILPTATGANLANAGGDQALGKPSFVTLFKNHIFVGGDPNFPNVVAHGSPSNDFTWTAAAGAGQLPVGFEIVQLKPFRDALFVLGSNKIKRIEVEGTNFALKDVANNMGCIASDSIVEINGDLVFLAADGLRPISATDKIGDVELASISKKIQPTLTQLIQAHAVSEINAVVIKGKSQIRLFFSDPADPDGTSDGIIGCLRETVEGLKWEWSKMKGIRSAVSVSGYIGRTEYVLHGDYDGTIYRQERGNTFDGIPIECLYKTPFLDFGDTQVRKTFRNINLFVRPEGRLTIGISFKNDWGDIYHYNPAGYIVNSTGAPAIYGEVKFGDENVVYGGASTPVMFTNIQGSGFSTQLTFTSNDTGPSHSIQGLVFEFSVDGRI